MFVVGRQRAATCHSWVLRLSAALMPFKVFEAPFARRGIVTVAQWPRNRHDPVLKWFILQVRAYFEQYYKV